MEEIGCPPLEGQATDCHGESRGLYFCLKKREGTTLQRTLPVYMDSGLTQEVGK
ncbi:hypothetical protein SAMN05421852_11022 [Thermoflavimicrobium dichotomicum]|uniref:Uncharacterized protein n=1 Tax=Thermoflavimicrobium dichotomicum TaxID=46223 RepID=A0A1I3RIS7_9BACL|nr:hypothetical protein SAMN05421852_11022 [Thermoflavimicrobium dichotomicum]